MERKAVYVLNLTLPPRHIDNCLEPAKASVQLKVRDMSLDSTSILTIKQAQRHGVVIPVFGHPSISCPPWILHPGPSGSKTRDS